MQIDRLEKVIWHHLNRNAIRHYVYLKNRYRQVSDRTAKQKQTGILRKGQMLRIEPDGVNLNY